MSQKYLFLSLILLSIFPNAFSQSDTVNLKEVVISTNRISIPYFKTSRTITLISRTEIENAGATNVTDLLQEVAGVDIRRRGVDGTQADLYMRGGNFDQTLLLIDGMKLDDPQTGHHTMNAILSIDNIERIEIIKGPAARVFGQNAFTGAINIVTRSNYKNSLKANLAYGSYSNFKGAIGLNEKFEKGGIQVHLEKQKSDGYRYNTDFENTSLFLKTDMGDFQLLTSFNDRKFGANGFYASPDFIDQYEETQASLVALSTSLTYKNLVIKPRIYWRRNQDMYLFLRDDPDFYRNLHISNKISAEANAVLSSKFGETGFGIDISKVYLVSNNLGDHNRFLFTTFFEHRFEFGNRFDVTPGIALSYFSDFNTKFFPGIDLGYEVSDKVKFYGNIGYTYRIPTFTDLYYVGPTTQGNPNLKPESALAEEIGIKFTGASIQFQLALFNRNSDNLIDWTKDSEEEKWQTRNFSNVTTKGFETSVNYSFKLGEFDQRINVSYNYIDDKIKDENIAFTRYSLNSLKHQFTTTLNTQIFSFLHHNLQFRFIERTNGESYNVVDTKLKAIISDLEFFVLANNIFNSEYTETNLVPMPTSNMMFGVSYRFY